MVCLIGWKGLGPDDRASIARSARTPAAVIEEIPAARLTSGGGRRRARPPGRARGLRGALQRDGGGPAERVLRGPAGLLPERRGRGGDPRARPAVLGLAVHRAGGDLPGATVSTTEGSTWPSSCRRWCPGGGRDPVHRRSRDLEPQGRHVDAARGLGEALVSGLVTADGYTVRDDEVVARTVGAQQPPPGPPGGGTRTRAVEPERQRRGADGGAGPAAGASSGRRIEAHFGRPQDIEWCLVGEEFSVVQSRPITTLFPVPATDDGENHVYVSVGHQQMMTDAMKPLGLSFWTDHPAADGRGGRAVVRRRRPDPGHTGGPRADPGPREVRPVDRGRAADRRRPRRLPPSPPDGAPAGAPADAEQAPLQSDPALVAEFIQRSRASLAAPERDTRRGPDRSCSTSSAKTSGSCDASCSTRGAFR